MESTGVQMSQNVCLVILLALCGESMAKSFLSESGKPVV